MYGVRAMGSSEEAQSLVFELRGRVLDVVEELALSHPGIPVQAVLAGLGEVFLQLALTHLGPMNTLQLIEHLREAAYRFGNQAVTEH